jgi:hypothetical protein
VIGRGCSGRACVQDVRDLSAPSLGQTLQVTSFSMGCLQTHTMTTLSLTDSRANSFQAENKRSSGRSALATVTFQTHGFHTIRARLLLLKAPRSAPLACCVVAMKDQVPV